MRSLSAQMAPAKNASNAVYVKLGFLFFIGEAQFLFNIGYTVYNDRLTQS